MAAKTTTTMNKKNMVTEAMLAKFIQFYPAFYIWPNTSKTSIPEKLSTLKLPKPELNEVFG